MYADGLGTIYSNTPAGRLAWRQWARSVGDTPLETLYGYNDAGDLSGVDYSDSTPDVAYTYNRKTDYENEPNVALGDAVDCVVRP